MINNLLNRILDLFLSFIYKVFIHHHVICNTGTPNSVENLIPASNLAEVPVDPVAVKEITEDVFLKNNQLSIAKSVKFIKELVPDQFSLIYCEFALNGMSTTEEEFYSIKKTKDKFFKLLNKEPISEYVLGYVLKLHMDSVCGFYYHVVFITNLYTSTPINELGAELNNLWLTLPRTLSNTEEFYLGTKVNGDKALKKNLTRVLKDAMEEDFDDLFSTPDGSRTVVRKVLKPKP